MVNPATSLPVLGLMLGDMTGIGPEISAKLLAGGHPPGGGAASP